MSPFGSVDGLEVAGHQQGQAAEIPFFPIGGGDAEFAAAREHAGHIDSHGRAQVVFHQAQHLEGLLQFDGPPFQAEIVAQARPRN